MCVVLPKNLRGSDRANLSSQVFESLRDAPRDPFADVAETDTSVRSILASHLTHESAIGGTNSKASRLRQPEFSHRLANGPVRYNPMLSRLKVTMGAEATYNSFREALSLAETVRSGEEMAARLRVSAMRRQQQRGGGASLDARTLSDAAYESEIEEAKVRRQVHAMSHLSAETRQRVRQQEQVAKHEENLAFFAAISLQPAVRAVIEAALDDEWMVGDGGSETHMVAKRLSEAKAINSRELYIAQVRPGIRGLSILNGIEIFTLGSCSLVVQTPKIPNSVDTTQKRDPICLLHLKPTPSTINPTLLRRTCLPRLSPKS